MAGKGKEWLSGLLSPAKTRKLRFQVKLTIHDLTQYPILGELYVKWKDGHGGSGETRRAALDPTQHTCVWEEAFDMELKFLVDNETNVLLPRALHLSVRQVNPRTGEAKRVGEAEVNLSEFVASGRKTRAYILQECKVNCSIRLTVQAKQVMGDPLFRCPLAAAEQPESYQYPEPPPRSSMAGRARQSITPPPPIETRYTTAGGGAGEGGVTGAGTSTGIPASSSSSSVASITSNSATSPRAAKRGSGSRVTSPVATEELLFGSAVSAPNHGHRVTMSIGELGRMMLGERGGRDSLDSSTSGDTGTVEGEGRSRATSSTERPEDGQQSVVARALNLLTLSPRNRDGADAIGEVGNPKERAGHRRPKPLHIGTGAG